MPESPNTKQSAKTEREMGFLEHLDDLRKALTRCLAAAFLGMLACYAFAKQLFNWLMLPLFEAFPEGSSMIYTAPHEAFFTYIKTAFLAGLFLTSPYIFYQLWLFVKPGLYSNERKYIFPISLCSALLFLTGSIFGYFIIFPFAYQFFMGFANIYIEPMISMKEGFSFSFRLLLAFGVVFELPLVIFFLARLGLVSSQKLRKVRKYSILIAFLLSAMLTPPDVFTQTFMAGPLIILYEVGIWIAYFFGKKEPEREQKKQAKESKADAAG